MNVAVADPAVTVPEIAATPIWPPPLETVKVTAPTFTVPWLLVTEAESVTF
jgi:hypothetical protein